jgi:phage shock protein PspC (stress-responsive transcriptional regulator)
MNLGDSTMSTDSLLESIKENLNGRAGQPIVLGVCNALAKRCEQEVWVFRAAAIVLGVFFTFATLAAYIVLGLFLPETEQRTKGLFRGLSIWASEALDRLAAGWRELFGHDTGRNGTR